jgi:hypothetical protein
MRKSGGFFSSSSADRQICKCLTQACIRKLDDLACVPHSVKEYSLLPVQCCRNVQEWRIYGKHLSCNLTLALSGGQHTPRSGLLRLIVRDEQRTAPGRLLPVMMGKSRPGPAVFHRNDVE